MTEFDHLARAHFRLIDAAGTLEVRPVIGKREFLIEGLSQGRAVTLITTSPQQVEQARDIFDRFGSAQAYEFLTSAAVIVGSPARLIGDHCATTALPVLNRSTPELAHTIFSRGDHPLKEIARELADNLIRATRRLENIPLTSTFRDSLHSISAVLGAVVQSFAEPRYPAALRSSALAVASRLEGLLSLQHNARSIETAELDDYAATVRSTLLRLCALSEGFFDPYSRSLPDMGGCSIPHGRVLSPPKFLADLSVAQQDEVLAAAQPSGTGRRSPLRTFTSDKHLPAEADALFYLWLHDPTVDLTALLHPSRLNTEELAIAGKIAQEILRESVVHERLWGTAFRLALSTSPIVAAEAFVRRMRSYDPLCTISPISELIATMDSSKEFVETVAPVLRARINESLDSAEQISAAYALYKLGETDGASLCLGLLRKFFSGPPKIPSASFEGSLRHAIGLLGEGGERTDRALLTTIAHRGDYASEAAQALKTLDERFPSITVRIGRILRGRILQRPENDLAS